jgi:transposase
MPRRILEPISSNERSRSKLNDGKKNRIVSRYLEGARLAKISRAESVPDLTVRSVINRYNQRGHTLNQQRSGRPTVVIARERRSLIRAIRKEPKLTFKALRHEV